MLLLHDIGNGASVNVTATGAHHQAFQRSKTHAGVHALAVFNGRDGSAVADVAGDDTLSFRLHAQELAHTLRHVTVGGAVEAVTANAVLLVQLVGHGIHVGIVRHSLVESGVEHAHLGHVGQDSRDGVHALQIGRVVQRSQVVAGFKGSQHLRRQQDRLAELLAAVHHAMAHGINFVHGLHHAILGAGQRLQDEFHTGCVLRDVLLQDFLLAVGQGQLQERVLQTDFLDAS